MDDNARVEIECKIGLTNIGGGAVQIGKGIFHLGIAVFFAIIVVSRFIADEIRGYLAEIARRRAVRIDDTCPIEIEPPAPEHLKRAVRARANHRCEACNCRFAGTLDVHHIKPRSEGGQNTLNNLIALCPNCHRIAHQNLRRN